MLSFQGSLTIAARIALAIATSIVCAQSNAAGQKRENSFYPRKLELELTRPGLLEPKKGDSDKFISQIEVLQQDSSYPEMTPNFFFEAPDRTAAHAAATRFCKDFSRSMTDPSHLDLFIAYDHGSGFISSRKVRPDSMFCLKQIEGDYQTTRSSASYRATDCVARCEYQMHRQLHACRAIMTYERKGAVEREDRTDFISTCVKYMDTSNH